ncbi:unnamed protein product, partial [Ixodes hexagonus]
MAEHVTFRLQSGPVWDMVKMNRGEMTLESLNEKAYQLVCSRFPEHGLNRLNERLLLLRLDCENRNTLLPVSSASDVTEGTVLEVVVSANHSSGDVQIQPHSLKARTFTVPTFCNFCGVLIFGLIKQGLRCKCKCRTSF